MQRVYELAVGRKASDPKQHDTTMVRKLAAIMESNIPEVFGAKYKPVDKRKVPIAVSMPAMTREPYKPLPEPEIKLLPHHPPNWRSEKYSKKLTKERMDIIFDNIQPNFLSDEEIDLLIWVLRENEDAISFEDSERGCFKPEYFPDYVMETVPHEPWREAPIRIPKAVKSEMTDMLRKQVESGNLEPAHASYRSRVFVVQKPKGGLRIVHDLQPLNAVSVQDAMLPPNVYKFAEGFIGYSVYATMDLYSGYHQRRLHPGSRPLTACQTPLGNMQLTSLPMGYTNSLQEFQRATTHVTHNMGPEKSNPFVDDIGVKGPKTRYDDELIPENPKIRRFIWEFAHTLFESLATLIIAGATASGKKLVLAAEKVNIVGYICSLEGMRPHHGIVTKILNWPAPTNLTKV